MFAAICCGPCAATSRSIPQRGVHRREFCTKTPENGPKWCTIRDLIETGRVSARRNSLPATAPAKLVETAPGPFCNTRSRIVAMVANPPAARFQR